MTVQLFLLSFLSTLFRPSLSADIEGEILAFVDVNYDRFTDLIVKQDQTLVVYKSVTEETDLKFTTDKPRFVKDPSMNINFTGRGLLANVASGDFNADSFPDLLVSTLSGTLGVGVTVCWGSGDKFTCDFETKYLFSQQPIVLNCDDDPITDFLAVEKDGTTVNCYRGQKNVHKLSPILVFTKNNLTLANAAHGFVDINGDLNADLVFQVDSSSLNVTVRPKLPVFQVWTRTGPGVEWSLDPDEQPSIPVAPSLVLDFDRPNSGSTSSPDLFYSSDQFTTGHVIFDDFNRDGYTDLLVPVCQGPPTDRCQKFWLLVWSGGQKAWFWLVVDGFHNLALNEASRWTFPDWDTTTSDVTQGVDPSLLVRSGDYTQNGFPDLLVVLANKKNKSQAQAFFIENVPCNPPGSSSKQQGGASSKSCASFGRTFALSFTQLTPCPYVKTATFFDLGEDGTLDLMYECKNVSSAGSRYSRYSIEFTNWNSDHDTTFLKVQTYTATCGSLCFNGKEGTGISLPGAALSYSMVDTEGNTVSAAYTQQSRTSHRALLLPYALFGLGRSPNFVDKLNLGVPHVQPSAHQTWQQIVPNSRMYFVPFPADNPSHWVGRLYVTPSRLILLSVSALGGVCLLILITVLVLQCYEMRQDKKERDVLKKRFHFDAM